MAPKRKDPRGQVRDIAATNFYAGWNAVWQHPLFTPLSHRAITVRRDGNLCPPGAWAVVTSDGAIHAHPTRRGEPEEWTYVLGHCLLHLAFGHFREVEDASAWNAACDVVIARFLAGLKLGRPPEAYLLPAVEGGTEERLYRDFREGGVPFAPLSDMVTRRATHPRRTIDWGELLAEGLAEAVTSAVSVAAGVEPVLGATTSRTPARRARDWFVSSYPLLGALASAFAIVEDASLCRRLSISIAAVDLASREIFINPSAGLSEEECRFVMAHELLHVGLRHDARRHGRDPELWNCAADYVINQWLVEMGVGQMPGVGLLYDPALKGESAEAVYDRVVTDLRRARKLATLRGRGLGDMLDHGEAGQAHPADGIDLDEFYRRCLAQGLAYHEGQGRGLLPEGLVEEIRALGQPPIPWDVELARWFDEHFPPLEKVRTFARPSRRQQATPDIPRPSRALPPGGLEGRMFGVVLDTSGSMDRTLLAKALGAIASYAMARDVPAARVVFCDAVAYDEGYLAPEAIAGRVRVRGRGGTVLQPGIDLLERAADFPTSGPLLIITDGYCDQLRVRREHAFLLPEGHSLPFVPRGPVFRIR